TPRKEDISVFGNVKRVEGARIIEFSIDAGNPAFRFPVDNSKVVNLLIFLALGRKVTSNNSHVALGALPNMDQTSEDPARIALKYIALLQRVGSSNTLKGERTKRQLPLLGQSDCTSRKHCRRSNGTSI